jgi:hypothetical protein
MNNLKLLLINIVKPWLIQIINNIDNLYEKDTTIRKHKVKGVPFDLISLLDDIINKSNDKDIKYLLIWFAMTYSNLNISSDNINIDFNILQECLQKEWQLICSFQK